MVVAAFLAQYHTETSEFSVRGQTMDQPLLTQDTSNRYALITSNLIKFRGTNIGQPVTEPLHTVTAGGFHHAEVRTLLVQHGGTPDSSLAIVNIHGVYYQIVDIGMRMLEPDELYAAQGFPSTYNISNYTIHGRRVPKAAQVARCGNSVPPAFAKALVRANMPEHCTKSGNRLTFERYTEAIGQMQLSM